MKLLLLFIVVASATRVLIVCGEHPREHITTRVCAQTRRLFESAHGGQLPEWLHIIDRATHSAYLDSDACRRTNDNGVDINRNWPVVCEPTQQERDSVAGIFTPDEQARTWPGPEPFSEQETRNIDAVIQRHRPHVVLSVHSGAQLLSLPWFCSGFHPLPARHFANVQLLREWLWVTNTTVPVRIGPAARDMYPATGTLCDWAVARRNVSLCVVAEIYYNRSAASSCSDYFGGQSTAGILDHVEAQWAQRFLFSGLSWLRVNFSEDMWW